MRFDGHVEAPIEAPVQGAVLDAGARAVALNPEQHRAFQCISSTGVEGRRWGYSTTTCRSSKLTDCAAGSTPSSAESRVAKRPIDVLALPAQPARAGDR